MSSSLGFWLSPPKSPTALISFRLIPPHPHTLPVTQAHSLGAIFKMNISLLDPHGHAVYAHLNLADSFCSASQKTWSFLWTHAEVAVPRLSSCISSSCSTNTVSYHLKPCCWRNHFSSLSLWLYQTITLQPSTGSTFSVTLHKPRIFFFQTTPTQPTISHSSRVPLPALSNAQWHPPAPSSYILKWEPFCFVLSCPSPLEEAALQKHIKKPKR